MASTVISNTVTNGNNIDRSKKKKKKKSLQSRDRQQQQQQQNQSQSQNQIRWKSDTQQQLYSSKLIQALSQVRLSNGGRRGRAVREAADTALAVAAKGRSRWSRAILTNRLKLKFRKQQRKRQRVTAAASSSSSSAVVTGSSRSKKPRVSVLRLKRKSLPAVQRKVRVLGRLVPGCRKQPLPVILDEATDYIAALEMQVRAMSALAQLFSGSSSGSGAAAASTSSAPPPS